MKRKEFLSLKQGDMTITEYERKFTKLAKYAMSYVVDEEEKCKHFDEGLRTTILVPMTASTNWSTFSKLVEEKKSSKEKRFSKEPMRMGVASHSVHQVSQGGPTRDKGK
ncbi:uncharacterized protein E6C27_scaffold697G00470 [Cucumis melo var. makuwa]|uniref:Retrotransposon gag domain-containing protein n=1 Tax=Cucumis melo var. makuwa TaxID=1194695 RepID=A0A5A7UNH7_CUCMM|nr:uncharacterized protein E6C27_scaffold697G00470 [Cucumis melo var. makuwa]